MATQGTPEAEFKKLAVSNQNQMMVISFDGSQFIISGRYVRDGWLPSWILFKGPNLMYAINPLGTDTSLLYIVPDYSPEANKRRDNWATGKSELDIAIFRNKLFADSPFFVGNAQGSKGGVHLEFNADQTRIVEASFFSGMIDIWDSSAADGSLKLIKSLSVPGDPSPGQKQHYPHQAVLDPTGRFFVVPDLGGDSLIVIDSKDDAYEIISTKRVPTGVGPRHVAFITNRGTHYLIVVTEFSSEIFLYMVHYMGDLILFQGFERQPTWATRPSNSKSRPAEVVVSRNQRAVYVSNRDTDDETDNIAHFVFDESNDNASLHYAGKVSTGGRQPRSFCLSNDPDQEYLFVSNESGRYGLQAYKRDTGVGSINPTPVATMLNRDLNAPGLKGQGPHFVCEI